MSHTKSILRYPGGKSSLSKFVSHLLTINHLDKGIYCEPFSGGAGISIDLLLSDTVKSIILNDLDISIFSVWNAVLNETEHLIDSIINTPVTIEEWHKQREIYLQHCNDANYSFELAYATFFLNRTNRAGIITGGPIGGLKQTSKYSIDCRFTKQTLIKKISQIASKKDKIHLYNFDASELLTSVIRHIPPNELFVFFDPPYYRQGKNLYKNSFTHQDHVSLYQTIRSFDEYNWITTYDKTDEIYEIYKDLPTFTYSLQYSANVTRLEKEYLFTSPNLAVESYKNIQLYPVNNAF
ncbi:DNA adenine methylase [Veillonella sp. CHU594]|uniref:DNA adenine methylase n=1 Tax=Veillonella sp. CHU594 TaxID=2490948 RepID=UPI000F8D3937|nr:DNA adenine methylase [Veillonella sp. CHU594]